jgi:hypothetical protein
MNTISQKSIKIIALLELAIAAGILAFWTAFFSTDLVGFSDSHLKATYLAFESAFPVADFFLVLLLVLGAVGLLRKTSYGSFFTLMAGACLIFLGLLDASFNSRQGLYLIGLAESVLNIGINAVCLAAGSFLIIQIWRRQHRQPPPKNPSRSERYDIVDCNPRLSRSTKGAL